MKNLMPMIAALTITSFVYAQKTPTAGIPENIKASFQKEFPNAKNVKWEKEDNRYEAEFVLNNTEVSVLFSTEGNLLETETEIAVSELPAGVLEYTASKYPGLKVKEAEKIIDAKGIITFEVELKNSDLIFDNKGVFIKEIKH